MMMLSMAASVLAVEVEIDGLWYELLSKTKEAKVIQYKNNSKYSGDIVIPQNLEYEGVTYSVTNIGDNAFSGCKKLTSITIPNSVTSIGVSAFRYCSGLTSVTIPNKVITIGSFAFDYCNHLTSVTIPNSVTTIEWCAFAGCSSLTSVTIPNSVTTIGGNAFMQCTGLTSATIGNSVTSLGEGCFWACSGLTSVTIPNSVINLENSTFADCSSLTSVTIPNSVTSIGNCTFENCSSLKSVTIPNSVTTIGERAFYGCTALATIIIGSGLKTIYERAFKNCSELADLYCYAANVPSMKKSDYPYQNCTDAFEGSYIEYATLHVPRTSINSYSQVEPWKNFKEIVTINMPKHTLTYIVDDDVYKTYEIEEGETITPEPTPTKEGYTFSGWSEIPETMPTHDVTVTGTFTINKYKLTYKVDGELYKSYEIEYGATITPEPAPNKDGYTFSGWSWIPTKMPAENVTVIGSFSINKYKLTYLVDGEVYKSYDVEYGATISPEPSPTKDGYIFSGWSDIPTTMPAHDVTVSGTFNIQKYKLTYFVDNAVYKIYYIEYGTSITPDEEPTKEGYTFSGWSWIPTKMPAEDVSVSGYFIVNQYTITYIIDNEVYTTDKVDYGSTITPPTPPSREGYDFAWGDYPETMPAHDITIYGTYTTGIDAIMVGECGNAKIYTLDGKLLDKPQKGINIVRMNDGTTKKVVVK